MSGKELDTGETEVGVHRKKKKKKEERRRKKKKASQIDVGALGYIESSPNFAVRREESIR